MYLFLASLVLFTCDEPRVTVISGYEYVMGEGGQREALENN